MIRIAPRSRKAEPKNCSWTRSSKKRWIGPPFRQVKLRARRTLMRFPCWSSIDPEAVQAREQAHQLDSEKR